MRANDYAKARGELIPVAIGTAIALETLFGVNKERPLKIGERPPFQIHDCIFINMSTIARNLINAMKINIVDLAAMNVLKEMYLSELTTIKSAIQQHTKGKLKIVFYYNDYTKISKLFRGNNFRSGMTDKQLIVYKLEHDLPRTVDPRTFPYQYTNYFIGKDNKFLPSFIKRPLFLTSYPMDLLLNDFSSVSLLESHTGRVKNSLEFNSKFKNKQEDVPFNAVTLQIYGDSSGYILPLDLKSRRAFSDYCKKAGINKYTDFKKFLKITSKASESEIRTLVNKLT